MKKYYDINKLKDMKFCILKLQRRKHGIIIAQKKKEERNKRNGRNN